MRKFPLWIGAAIFLLLSGGEATVSTPILLAVATVFKFVWFTLFILVAMSAWAIREDK